VSFELARPPEKLANQVRKHREPGSSVGNGLVGELAQNLNFRLRFANPANLART
jgi:hypothetical protein